MKLNRRLIHLWAGVPPKEEEMGEVRVKIRLTNNRDEVLARENLLKTELIRTTEIEALVDTGAVRSVIPARVREMLGIGTAFRTRARSADGRTEEVPVSEPIRLEIEGRLLYEECLVLGDEFLIGQTALEKTDLFVDCVGSRLVPNPAHPNAVIMPVR